MDGLLQSTMIVRRASIINAVERGELMPAAFAICPAIWLGLGSSDSVACTHIWRHE